MTDGSINFDTKIDSSGAKKDLKGLSGTLKKELGKIAGVVVGGSILRKVFQTISNHVKAAAAQNSEYSKSVSELNGAWATFAQLVIPIMTRVNDVITKVIYTITALIAKLTGNSLSALKGTAKNANDAAKATTKLAKAQKQLAGFDEMNKLEDSSSSGGAGAGSVDFNTDTSAIEKYLNDIEAIASAAALGLGLVLTLTGNPALGIPLMALGAAGIVDAVMVNWNSLSEPMQTAIQGVLAALSGAFLTLGAIFAFSGFNVPLGIGLMALGAAGLATVAAINWNGMPANISKIVGDIMTVVGAGLLTVGAMLALSGANIPLGLGLLAVGALSLGTAAAVNWSGLSNTVKNTVGTIAKYVGAALLTIGILLAASTVNIPLGLALVAAGATSLVAAKAPNWAQLGTRVSGVLGEIGLIAGGALSVIGLILLISGNLPLGLALLIAGLGSSYAAVKWSDSPLISNVKGTLNNILTYFESFINKIITGINWLVDRFNSIRFDVPDWVPGIGGKRIGFSIAHVGSVSLPRLAEGAVIPANREFLAVLGDQKHGTNIETPLATMIEAFETALGNYGGGDVTIPIYLDGKQIAKHVVSINQRRNFATNNGF